MLTVRCPGCQHDMLYSPRGALKTKECVYCGKRFTVHSNILQSRVICKGKRAEFNTPLF